MFRNYTESGPALMTDPTKQIIGRFTLDGTSTTVANTLRRCILSETRSAGFRADLTNAADPGITIRKNTSVIFNEMLAHRLTLVPVAPPPNVSLDDFDPTRYQCVLTKRNDAKGASSGLLHITASDFRIHEKQEDGTFADMGLPAAGLVFPPDPITGGTSLIVSLRPQWNPEQPPEEIDLTAYPIVGRGRDFMGFCPVSQCSFENTRDEDPVRQERMFNEWLSFFKKIADPSIIPPDVIANHRQEWSNMAIQRCFLVDEHGEPNSFGFVVESVGIRPVQEIVAEGIQAVIDLVSPYVDAAADGLGITTQPADSRMNGLDILFDDQEHTLGNLLQTLITDLYLSDSADSPIAFAGYKVKHPLHRVMTLRIGFREGVAGDAAMALSIVSKAAEKARSIFEDLARAWAAVSGSGSGPAAGNVPLDG